MPRQVALQAQWRQLQVQQRQALLDSLEPLPCYSAANCDQKCQFVRTGCKVAVYHGPLGVAGLLSMPVFRCETHGSTDITVHPLQINCVPTAPVENTKLLDVDLVVQFRLLQLKDGVAGHGYIEAHRLLKSRLQPDYASNLILSDEDLQAVGQVYGRWSDASYTILKKGLGLGPDPMKHCLVCAETFRDALRDGTPVPPHPCLAVMADGSCKPTHFASAGQRQQHIESKDLRYLGSVARTILQRCKTGELSSEAQQRYACAAADADGAEGEGSSSCSSQLTCSRASASARGVVDVAGLAGVACAHNVPLLNCMVAMPTPEQWAFHFATVKEALTRRPDIQHVYIDIGCRIREPLLADLRKLVEHDPPLLLPQILSRLKVMVPWMHGYDHDLPCQLKNSGLYQDGVGRRVGEQMEHLWSRGKPLFLVARYMTAAHWWDTINAFLALLTVQLQGELPQLLEKRLKDIEGTIDHYRTTLRELEQEARTVGIEDLASTLVVVDSNEQETASPLSKEARYVQLLLQLRSQRELRNQKAGLSLLHNGSRGADLHAEGSDTRREQQLKTACVRLETALGIPLGSSWQPGEEQYEQALREVARKVCKEEERTIQDHVFKLKLLQAAKANESGNAATKTLRRIIPLRTKIEKHLKKHAQWQAHRDGTAEIPVTDVLLKEICSGEFPWVAGAGNAAITSAQRHYAQRYRHLKAQHSRSVEERAILRVEVILAFNWLEEREGLINKRLAELPGGGNNGVGSGAVVGSAAETLPATGNVGGSGNSSSAGAANTTWLSWPQLLASGEAALLDTELKRVQVIHADAKKRLSKHKPAASTT